MAVVALIPTGKLEHAALPPALKILFPEHDFVAWPPESHLNGFTSEDVTRLASAQPGPVPTNLDKLAEGLVNAIYPGVRATVSISPTLWKTWNSAIKVSRSSYSASSVTPCLPTSTEPGPSNQNNVTSRSAKDARFTSSDP